MTQQAQTVVHNETDPASHQVTSPTRAGSNKHASKAPSVSPAKIMEVGMGFWASKTLLSAVELGVFTALAQQPMTGIQLEQALQLHPRATGDFLDALVALGFLERDGIGPNAVYRNTVETATFLDSRSASYVGGMLEMANSRLYGFWGDLTEALKTGLPQNEVKHTGQQMFEALYKDPAKLEGFMNAMTGISMANFHALAEKLDFSEYRSVCDVGGATAQLSIILAQHYPHLSCTSFDLPPVAPVAQRTIEAAGLQHRITTASGDFLQDPLPRADVITMSHILHDWDLENKIRLLRAAYEALEPGGVLISVESIIDDERRTNAPGLLMSLNMLIEFGDAFDFTGRDFDGWCKQVGFERTRVLPLAGATSAALAYKSR